MTDLADPPDDEVEAVLAEFGGDPRAAIRALLDDMEALARDADRQVSRGYVRGRRRRVASGPERR